SVSGAVLVLASVVLNTRLGMLAEEAVTDRAVRTWQLVRDDVLPGIFRLIMYVSQVVLEWVDRCLYSVDELLRFRPGQGWLTFLAKLVLGFVWFWVTYVVRFVVNLLIEPQVNPLKHFPVVTVSHKLMLLLVDPVARALYPVLGPRFPAWRLTLNKTRGLGTFTLGLGPGGFGFLAWELKENWRLCRAHQSAALAPVRGGTRGDTW